MIDDMAVLTQAMEQMDAEDPVVAQAAKDRAAQALSDAGLNFAKMAEMIEQRRLLLRPRIVAGIKRMDQPGMLGDAAFRDTGSALRREGQSFRQIAEAMDRARGPAPRYEDPVQRIDPLPRIDPMRQMPSAPEGPSWPRVLLYATGVLLFPLLHPIRFLALALLAIFLFYALRGYVGFGQQTPTDGAGIVRYSAGKAMSSVGTFLYEQLWRRPTEVAPPVPPAPIPSPTAAAVPVPVPVGGNSVASSSHCGSSPRKRTRAGPQCIISARTAFGGSHAAIGHPRRSAGFNAASQRKGRSPAREPRRGAGESLFPAALLRAVRRRSPARFGGRDTGRCGPQFSRVGTVYRWCRRLLLGRRSILTFCCATRGFCVSQRRRATCSAGAARLTARIWGPASG
jgi:hypothetical protein